MTSLPEHPVAGVRISCNQLAVSARALVRFILRRNYH
jgi:hypothetical protein